MTSAILDFVRRHDVQDSNRLISVPLAALLILNAFTAASLFDVLAYLRFLLTEPIILLGSKKRKWGVVYDSLTKEPIDLAMIRLESAQNKGIILQTRVTDRSGRFAFFAKPGKYTVSIVKPGFKFPTSYLANKNEDIGLASLYHGQTLSATEKEGVLHPNVPLDPEAREQTPRSVKLKKLSLRLRNVVACTGPVIGFMSFIITPSPLTGVSFAFQVGSLVMFRRIAIMRKPKRWGVIKDAVSSKPLSNVIIRIFDKQFNKLLETQITGLNGAYGFLVKKSTYFFTAEKSGFKKYVSPDIDFKGQDNLLVDQSFKMERTAPEDK